MATLSGNDIYLRMNSVNTQARWRKFDMSFKNDEEDTTAGVGVDWKSRAAKLSEIPAKIMLVYDDVAAATDFAALWQADMIFAVEYGPEGNGAGKPRHLGTRHTHANRSEQIGIGVSVHHGGRRQCRTTIATARGRTMAGLADLFVEVASAYGFRRIIGEWICDLRWRLQGGHNPTRN